MIPIMPEEEFQILSAGEQDAQRDREMRGMSNQIFTIAHDLDPDGNIERSGP
jgi:hypothetical protein